MPRRYNSKRSYQQNLARKYIGLVIMGAVVLAVVTLLKAFGIIN